MTTLINMTVQQLFSRIPQGLGMFGELIGHSGVPYGSAIITKTTCGVTESCAAYAIQTLYGTYPLTTDSLLPLWVPDRLNIFS